MNAYSNDLRQRIFNYSLNHSVRQTAKTFNVSPSMVQNLKKLFEETGSLTPREFKGEYPRLISEEGEMYLQVLLSKEVDLTLEKIIDNYEETYGIKVSVGTMFNTLRKLNITYKKKHFQTPKSILKKTKG